MDIYGNLWTFMNFWMGNISMGDLQDPTDWRYVNVLYISGHILGGYSLKFRPENRPYMVQYLHFRILERPLNISLDRMGWKSMEIYGHL